MQLRVCSDLHSCFWKYNKISKMSRTVLPPDDRDSEATLILAGDIGCFAQYPSTIKPILKELSPRFKHIVYILGNHEFYGEAHWDSIDTFWDDKNLPKNVNVLEDDYVVIDGVAFIGSTLWTSMNDRDPLAMFHASRNMSDFEVIRKQALPISPYSKPGIRITPEDVVDRHEKSAKFIFNAIDIHQKSYKTVVVTHHLPSFLSVPERFTGDLLNHAFATELGSSIAHQGPDLWVHGHTHNGCDYKIGESRIVCNPFGYHSSEVSPKYNQRLFIEV